MKYCAISGITGIVTVSLAGCSGKGPAEVKKPNIVFIIADDLKSDITEETDLSEKYPEIVKQIEEIMTMEHIKPEIERFNLFAEK